ncbi:hypothetical protein [Methylobacterium frigidaeris]|uniref:Uncharacterized protein n=1 Tax=Methylobacterium frigidaeris TaxID=2038277 RepID=A0AA37HI66_9HYPH|nr:hypothetical protein [Methylobacterium frigidaeris]PIK71366.1 hypothetical protein CS379_19745 [Methylobacterium frigidaeris]GJD66208.1 hypothetical protein MPEAHAMD_6405 [Methylobacterium frigidaeris]
MIQFPLSTQDLVALSYYNTILWTFVLSFVLSQRLRAIWLWFYLGVIGMILVTHVAQRVMPAGSAVFDVVALVTSVLSTWMLVQAALLLLRSRGRLVQGLLASALGMQVVSFAIESVVSASPNSVHVYQTLDACTCLGAAMIYSIALIRSSRGLIMRVCSVVGTSMWGLGCLEYWTSAASYPNSVWFSKIAMIAGIAITSAVTGVLAYQRTSDGTPQAVPVA